MAIVKYLHLLFLVFWFGGMLFFSFIAAPSIFKAFPRETAGDIVGAIFPKYFFIGYVCSLGLVGTFFILWKAQLTSVRAPFAILILMVALTLISGMGVGAKAREIKAEIRQTTDVVQKEALSVSFKKIHGISMILNLTLILLSLVYLAYLPTLLRL